MSIKEKNNTNSSKDHLPAHDCPMSESEQDLGIKNCIRLVPIFNHLDDSSMAAIADLVVTKHLQKNDYLYQMGDTTQALYVIHHGSIQISRLLENGKSQLVRILAHGDFVGEWSIFHPDKAQVTDALALEDTTICIIYQPDFKRLLLAYPEISLKLLEEMSRRLEVLEKQTTQLTTEQVGNRLALYLADLTSGAAEQEVEVILPMARKDIASYLGTTPETISRKFKQLEEEGLIKQISTRKILIHRVDDLILYES